MARSLRALGSVLLLAALCVAACNAYDRDRYRQLTDGRSADARFDGGDVILDAPPADGTDARTCTTCSPGETCCGTACVSLDNDSANCGACGHNCVHTTCSTGSCTNTCLLGYIDCNSNVVDGCEVSAADDSMNCGRCGNACNGAHATEQCAAGTCVVSSCAAGFADCDRNASNGCEVDLANDPSNCGSCGTVCTAADRATASCAAMGCHIACLPGFADCDETSSTGCEANLGDATHCGSCATVCSGTTPVCSSRAGSYTCTNGCDATQTRCGSSCVDAVNDPNNCGACGNVCPRPAGGDAVCLAGTCRATCPGGRTQCGNTCTDVLGDVNNCGACGNACPRTSNGISTCASGACGISCNAGFHLCGSSCVDNTSVATCGTRCSPCESRANSVSNCNGVGCGFACNAGFGDCDGSPTNGCESAIGGSCNTDEAGCVRGTRACGSAGGVECVSAANVAANTPCGTDRLCDGAGICHDILVTGAVHCGTGPLTADQVCMGLGFAGATFARGYGWFQCAGPLERCPGGWQGDGTQCPDWCSGTDCVGVGFCSISTLMVHELSGDGTTYFDPRAIGDCVGGNPGWTIRLRCHY